MFAGAPYNQLPPSLSILGSTAKLESILSEFVNIDGNGFWAPIAAFTQRDRAAQIAEMLNEYIELRANASVVQPGPTVSVSPSGQPNQTITNSQDQAAALNEYKAQVANAVKGLLSSVQPSDPMYTKLKTFSDQISGL